MRTRSWDLGADGLSQLLCQLEFRFHKWDAWSSGRCLILPESIVLSPAEHARAVGIVERFARLLARIETHVRADPRLFRRLAIPEALEPLVRKEPGSPLQLARYDLFPTCDGRWMVSEFNEDAPGGFNEAVGIPALTGGRLPGGQFLGDLAGSVRHALAPCRKVALLHATGYSEDLQHMLAVRDWLEPHGHECLLASPAHLTASWPGHRPRFLGYPVDAAVRFFPGEWFGNLPNLTAWERAVPHLPMMNPLGRLVRQSKRLFIDWGNLPDLDPADRLFLQEHAPVTVDFDPTRLREWISNPHRWVLKHAFGRMGDTVVIGALASPDEWGTALARAMQEPGSWLMQERFDAVPLDFGMGPLYPALGLYLVNGRFAGYYSRVASSPFITHEAFHVATLVESP